MHKDLISWLEYVINVLLYCIEGVVIAANALRPFQIYCAPPN